MTVASFKNKTNKRLAILLLLNVAFISACKESSDTPASTNSQYVQQATAYLEQQQFKAAFSAAEHAIVADPKQLDGYLLLASIYQQSGAPKKSIKVLEKFNGIKNVQYYFSLLEAYQRAGKLNSANRLINQHLSLLETQKERLQLAQAQQLLYSQKLQQAQIAFQQLSQEETYKVTSMLALAEIEMQLNHSNKALIILDKVMQLEPQNTKSLIIKSQLYSRLGDIDNAEKQLSLALSSLPAADIFTPDRIAILHELITILTQQGRSAEAMIYSRILATEFPNEASAKELYSKALELYKNRSFVEAQKVLLDILELAPNHQQSATLLGLILYHQGDIINAEKYLANIVDPETSSTKLTQFYAITQLQLNKSTDVLLLLESLPEAQRNINTWLLYISAAIKEKQFEKAQKALQQAKLLAPESKRLILQQVAYYNHLEKPLYEKALQSIETGLQQHPENPALQLAYIQQLQRLERNDNANSYVNALSRRYRENITTQLIVASYRIYQKKFSEAQQILATILKKDPSNMRALFALIHINKVQQEWQSALQNYRKIIAISPEQLIAYQGAVLSMLYLQQDPLNAAMPLPDNHNPALLALILGELALQQNKPDLSHSYIEKASNAIPDKYQQRLENLKQQLLFKEVFTAITNGEDKKARELVSTALRNTPNDTNLLTLLARIEVNLEAYSEAQKIIEQIAQLSPDSFLPQKLSAENLLAQQKPQQAIDFLLAYWQKSNSDEIAEQIYKIEKTLAPEKAGNFLKEWRNKLPNSRKAMRTQALLLQEAGKAQQALDLYEKIIKEDPAEIVSLNNAAWLYADIDSAKALYFAEKAYKLMPNNAAILDTYAWIQFQHGDKPYAKALIEKANQLSPNDKDIEQHLKVITNQ